MINQNALKEFNSIYDKTYNSVLKYVVSKCSNIEDVNDIINDIYLDVYNLIARNKNIEDYQKYILGIAKNKVRKYYTLSYKVQTISLFSKKENFELLDTIHSEVDIEKIVIETEDILEIWDFLKSKKIIIQKIFYLYYSLDLTIKEISKELNIGESYTKNCLYRTLKELQEHLRKDCD